MILDRDAGNAHSLVVAVHVSGSETGKSWEQRTTADTGNDPGRTTLGVSAEATNGQGKDGREDA